MKTNDDRSESDETPAPEAEKRPAEAWATAAGLLPQFDPSTVPPRPNPNYWKFAGARAFKGWESGQLVTEQEFNDALQDSQKQTYR